ncbi:MULTISPECIES: family 1 glycosylhydrolase [Acidianus]|uniref:Beta-galactosidase n=1 Tax=Candidatus Acidianus copahuensis TaxID=1160895 RepID=A0A031LU88_9CREN|nr:MULTISPECIES: family 1 glycosylhydrolase [Acidianus]EZQ10688.1 beta-galactosidase [Candidatus Acidianus copahuensis]NON63412.1 glycoside hydrolase family 1 protein [Acidianus sp. RZ1]
MLYGFSASAFQYEEFNPNSDWGKWLSDPTNVILGKVSGLPIKNFYLKNYDKIHDLARKINANAWRTSLSWERIMPVHGKISREALLTYRKILKDLKDKGFTVFLCLNHFVLPLWIHDPITARESFLGQGSLGWYSKDTIKEFKEFSLISFDELSEYVDFWCTFNEPNAMINFGYLSGIFPPGISNQSVSEKVTQNVIDAHNQIYDEFRKRGTKTGIVYNFPAIEGDERLKDIMIWKFLSKVNIDWIGVNYYSRLKFEDMRPIKGYGFLCQGNRSLDGYPVSDYGWEIYPRGIKEVIEDASKLGKPIYITENGVADSSDSLRPKFILEHLEWITKSNAKVEGYLHWSLIDNFEWNFGYDLKFGVYDFDMKEKPSALVFKEATQMFG